MVNIPGVGVVESPEPINIGPKDIRDDQMIGTAVKQLQRLIIDRVFSLLSRRSKTGSVVFAGKNFESSLATSSANRSRRIKAPFGHPRTTTRKTVINFTRPDADTDFTENFRDVMLVMARFIDEAEDLAGGKNLDHLLPDRTGRSRYLSISSSTRLLIGFELMATLISTHNFSFLGNLTSDDQVKIQLDRSKAKTFIAAAATKNPLLGTKFKSRSNIKFLSPQNVNNRLGRATRRRLASSVVVSAANHINEGLLEEFK